MALLELSLFVTFSCPVKHRELHLYPGMVSTHLMGMDKWSLQLSKEIWADPRPGKHPGHREAGSHTFWRCWNNSAHLYASLHFKGSHKNATEAFFLQAVPFWVSFVVLFWLISFLNRHPLLFQGLYLNSWAILFFLPAFLLHLLLSIFWHEASVASLLPLLVLGSSYQTPSPFFPSHGVLLRLGAATTHPSHPPHPRPTASSLPVICLLPARQARLHSFIRWPGGEAERAVT